MKKTLKLLLLLIITALFFSGCEKKDYSVKEQVITSSIIYDLDVKLNENNLNYNKIESTENDQNASGCYYYYFEKNNPIVIYVFNENSEDYKKIDNEKEIYTNDSPDPIEVETHKGLVIEKNNTISNYDEIINIIKSL